MDVRDVATFAISNAVGVYNVVGPPVTMSAFLEQCRKVTGSDASFEWITDEEWLIAQGVAQWTELPLWRTYRGAWSVDSAAAVAAGLRWRGPGETVAHTWEWMNSGEAGIGHERGAEQGIDPTKETAILGIWDARELDHCG